MLNHNDLILLFGMPRSGTTWIGKIFDSHPNTLYVHEPDSWIPMNEIPLFCEGDTDSKFADYLNNYMAKLPNITKAEVTTKLPVFKKDYQSTFNYLTYKSSIYISSLMGKAGVDVNPVSRVSQSSKPFVTVWKSISSLGRLPLLSNQSNHPHCIHIVRNPAGYIASVIRGEESKKFTSSTPDSEDYNLFQLLLETEHGRKLGLTLDNLKQLYPIERLAIRWQLFNEIAYDGCKDKKNYTLLCYEDLCREPTKVAKMLFEKTGLTWSKQTDLFLNSSVANEKKAYYSIYKDPLKAAYKWRNVLTSADIQKIISILNNTTAFKWYQGDFESYIS